MKHFIFLSFILTYARLMSAQQCNCTERLQFIIHETETNYSGFHDKVNSKTRKSYDALVKNSRKIAGNANREQDCMMIIGDYLSFFKDHHLQFYKPDKSDPKDTIAMNDRIKKTEYIKLSEKKLEELAQSDDYEEGIYYSFDSSYKVALLKSKTEFRDYAAVIIESKTPLWQPGMVKLELKKKNDSTYTSIVYYRDHSFNMQNYYFNGAAFDGGNWTKAGKTDPIAIASKTWKYPYNRQKLDAQQLTDSAFYIKIGSFDISNLKAIDSMFKSCDPLLQTLPYLIIDIRNNGGGGDASYDPIIKYLYTNPIVGIGTDVYATADNTIRFQQYLDEPDLPDENKKEIRQMIDSMAIHPGKMVQSDGNDTLRDSVILNYPRKVVILINDNCGSTTEQFVLAARQSKKVTLMGMHTSGTLDYSNLLKASSPCKEIAYYYATTRSRRLDIGQGIDGKGIQPNINLSRTQDWIAAALKYLEGR